LGIQHERAGHPEAATSFERVVAIREALARDHPTSLRYRTGLSWGHINLAIARAKAGRPAEALVNLRKAEQLIGRLPHNDPNTLCKRPCAHAQCGAAARRGGRDLSPTDLAELETCADRAMAALRRAVAAGFAKAALIRRDTDLDPLRRRRDFQELMLDL